MELRRFENKPRHQLACRRRLTGYPGRCIGSSGVAAGIITEFQFGTNWGHCSRYADDIFGAPLAIEGLAAAAPERHVHANFLPDDKIDADD